jgi:uncharacterized protein YaaR (DUF327 family)
MARIDSLGEASPWLIPEKKKAQKKEKLPPRSFARLVESAAEGSELSGDLSEGSRRRSIEELLDGVFAAGDRLKSAPTIDTIREYRQKVRAFVQYAVDHMLAVEETTSGVNIMKRKRFTLVKVIDEKLDELAASVLAAQKEQLGILAQVDEINGLLVDLVS